jgi:predicted nucleotidyltransferase
VTDFERLLRTLSSNGVEFVIIGGAATMMHGSPNLTNKLELVYGRSTDNIRRLAAAIAPLKPYERGAPPGLPFRFDEPTIRAGLNFTLVTEAGPLDLLGEIAGVGKYDALSGHTIDVTLYGTTDRCIDLDTLIKAKRAAGRPKDLEVIAELEAIRKEQK